MLHLMTRTFGTICIQNSMGANDLDESRVNLRQPGRRCCRSFAEGFSWPLHCKYTVRIQEINQTVGAYAARIHSWLAVYVIGTGGKEERCGNFSVSVYGARLVVVGTASG